MYTLKASQVVPVQRDEIFEFFARPENLGRITPDWLSFRILTPSPVPMREGAILDYRIGLAGLPQRWRSIISTTPLIRLGSTLVMEWTSGRTTSLAAFALALLGASCL